MSETRYSDFIQTSKLSNEYWTETAITDFTEELCRLMENKGVTRADLAQRIGHSQAYVTKVLRGNVNFTLATMTKLARALDAVVRVHLAPEGVVVEWNDRAVDQPVLVQYQEANMGNMPCQVVTAQVCAEAEAEPNLHYHLALVG